MQVRGPAGLKEYLGSPGEVALGEVTLGILLPLATPAPPLSTVTVTETGIFK